MYSRLVELTITLFKSKHIHQVNNYFEEINGKEYITMAQYQLLVH